MGEHHLPRQRSSILGADGRAAFRAPEPRAEPEIIAPSAELNARVPMAARVGYNEGMVWIVFDPGLPSAVAFGLDLAAARALGEDLTSAATRNNPAPKGD